MSPTCVVLANPIPHPSCISAALPQKQLSVDPAIGCGQGRDWVAPLLELSRHHIVSHGTPAQLAGYQEFVRSRIQEAVSSVQGSAAWRDSGLGAPLRRALELCEAGRTSQARNAAVELIGFATLAEQLKCNVVGSRQFSAIMNHQPGAPVQQQVQAAASPPLISSSCQKSSSSSQTSSSNGAASPAASSMAGGGAPAGAFKVPAVPAKRQRSPEQQQQQVVVVSHDAPSQHQQPRRHSAPKRRATPQVLSAGPCDLTPAAPPASGAHGEACCDEQLLSSWCPMSAKRQRLAPAGSPPGPDSSCDSQDSSSTSAAQLCVLPELQQQEAAAAAAAAAPAAPALPHASSTSSWQRPPPSPPSQQKQQQAQPRVPPLPPRPVPASASARSGIIERLKTLMHEDPAAQPAADVLLFNEGGQLPINSWSGAIKHKSGGRVVEVCKVTLQVPEAFLEEFPAALYAAEVRHRRSVSLGRHVVCRASLASLTEHQLASLAAMARGQLVALCVLQTAELHLVPYFDNRNLVRLVGFLKVKAAAPAP